MKIRGRDNEAANQTQEIAKQRQQLEGVRQNAGAQIGKLALGNVGEDRVNVNLGRAIQEEFDSLGFDPARKQRVDELKKLVQSGQYNPPTDAVARAVGEDIVFEILTSRAAE